MDIREPLAELRSTKLFQRLEALEAVYAQRTETFLSVVAPILGSTAEHFPYYTRHDAHHGFRVVRRVEQVIKPECLLDGCTEALTAPEIYLIILAAYAHDLGMTVFPGEADRLLQAVGVARVDGWETDARLQGYLRREHSKRGGTYILENAATLGVPTNLADALDRMMRAHNMAISDLESEISPDYAAGEALIDVRQLAIIICVADALEFSDTRVVDGVLKAVAKDPSAAAHISYLENMKHVCVGDSLAIDADGRVVISGTFLEAEVLALAHATFDQMEGWIQGYCDLDRRLKTPRLRIRAEPFTRNLAFPSGRFERLGVRLNKRNVIDLIASNAVWQESGGLVVRELLQNAVEACRYRRHHSSQADAYMPAVSVTFDRDRGEITVADNGCGMTERVILNNLLTVGSSRAAEPGYASADYAPIARFGVGFWSVFTLAQSASVETTPSEVDRTQAGKAGTAYGTAFDVSLDEMKEYTVFRPVQRSGGTTVRLKVRDGIALDDVYASALAQIVCSEVPVLFRLDGEDIQLPTSIPDVPAEAVLGSRGAVVDEHGIQLFSWRGQKGDTELSLCLAYRIVDEKPTFLIAENTSLLQALPSMRHSQTAICGFTAPVRTEHICIDLHRVGTYAANRTTPHGMAFSLDRRQLIDNEASRAFAQEITDLIHDGYRAFLDQTGGRDLATVAELRRQSMMHGGNIFDTFTDSELFEAAKRFPDLAPIKLWPVPEGEPIYVRADELSTLEGAVCFMQRSPYQARTSSRGMFDMEGEAGAKLVRDLLVRVVKSDEPLFAMEVDRTSSWVFDGDPESTAFFMPTPANGSLCLQVAQLGRIDVSQAAQALVKVTGRWTGTVYLRDFETPDGKPYLLLGRHRVLIRQGTALAEKLEALAATGRHMKIANLVADLLEDERGYTPSSVSELVSS